MLKKPCAHSAALRPAECPKTRQNIDEMAYNPRILAAVLVIVLSLHRNGQENLAGLRSYPDAVQCIVREKLPETVPKPKSLCSILLSILVFFTALFSAIGQVLKNVVGLSGFPEAFYFFLILGEGLGLFDLLIIDLIWLRNAKRIRFSFLPDKTIYQNPRKHIESFARGILLYAAVAALSAWIVAC